VEISNETREYIEWTRNPSKAAPDWYVSREATRKACQHHWVHEPGPPGAEGVPDENGVPPYRREACSHCGMIRLDPDPQDEIDRRREMYRHQRRKASNDKAKKQRRKQRVLEYLEEE